MQTQDADLLCEEIKTMNATLKQMKDDLAVVKTEVHTIHSQITELPSGKQFGEVEVA